MAIELDTETEALIITLAEHEHISAAQFVKNLLIHFSPAKNNDDFFSCAGIWEGSDINQETIRSQAWKRENNDFM